MSEKALLEVGDMVYGSQNGMILSRHRIARVTKTQAISQSGAMRFKREHRGEFIDEVGADKWSRWLYQPGSPELEEGFQHARRARALVAIKNADWLSLGSDVVEQVHSIYVAAKKKEEQTKEAEEEI